MSYFYVGRKAVSVHSVCEWANLAKFSCVRDLVVTGLKFPLICPNLAMCTSVCVPGPTGRGLTFHCLTDIDMFLRNENSSFVQKMSRGITMGRQT